MLIYFNSESYLINIFKIYLKEYFYNELHCRNIYWIEYLHIFFYLEFSY